MDTGRDQASLWRVINDGLGRGAADPGFSAEAFADYFDRKVADIRYVRPAVRFRACYYRRCLHDGAGCDRQVLDEGSNAYVAA